MEAYYRNLKAMEARNGSVSSADDSMNLTAMEADYQNQKAIRAGKGAASGSNNTSPTAMEAHYRNQKAIRASKGAASGTDNTVSIHFFSLFQIVSSQYSRHSQNVILFCFRVLRVRNIQI
ncbi:hypothetical protein LguiB_013375 [Lonicera macranthoides]